MLLLLLLSLLPAQAGRETATLRGTWSATAGGRQLYGTWTARPVEGAPDTMVGSWTLAAGASRIGYGGTWSAVKTANRWSGSWRARVSGRQGDREMAGTWRADVKAPANTTLAGMFELASAQAITGTWRSGSLAGTWSLNGADARTK